MNKEILKPGVQQYILNFKRGDILAVAFKKQLFPGIENKELVQQLEGRRKCQKKLPLWYCTRGIYYPSKRALEQSSSQQTAIYKSELVSGKTLIDITGGFGVDSFFLSQRVEHLYYCEKTEELASICMHNFEVLGAQNIQGSNIDGLKYLKQTNEKVDWIYLDPSRRDRLAKKVFLLEDAEPTLPSTLPLLWQKSDNLLIKTSPLLDISAGLKALEFVKELHILAIRNEVKELLWVLKKDFVEATTILAVNLLEKKTQVFSFTIQEERSSISEFSHCLAYLYEPNAAIMKSGAFKLVAARYGLKKLHEHTHLYTSDALVEFPGKRFRLETSFKYSRRNIKKSGVQKANIISRNFPHSVAELRKKHGITDGGDISMFFTTNPDDHLVVLQCRPI